MSTTSSLWTRFQKFFVRYPQLGFSIDISRMAFEESLFDSMAPSIEKAFVQMKELEAGAIANPDEGRMVGHYWLRNSALAPADLRAEIDETLEATLKFAADVHSGAIIAANGQKFTRVLVVGIGGSALGPQLVAQAITPANPPLEISFFDNTDPDGMDRITAQIGAELATTVTLVISKSGGTKETRNGMLEAAGHEVQRGPSAYFPGLHPKRWKLNQRLYAQIKAAEPDFVHTTSTWLAYQHKRITAPARIATVHDLYPTTIPNFFPAGLRSRIDVKMLSSARGGFRTADGLICISRWTASVLSEWAQIDPARISVVNNIVHESFAPVADAEAKLAAAGFVLPARPRMLTVGTTGWTKNLTLAIRTLAAPGMKGIHYVRVGPKLPPDMAALAANIGVADRITELPFVPEELLPAVYSACDVLVQPSLVEGFGYPVAEAMACGTPVVCSDGGALPEVAGDAALIVPLHTPPHLADEGRAFACEIERVVSDPVLAAELRRRGLEQVKRFRRDAISPQLLAVYERARDTRAAR